MLPGGSILVAPSELGAVASAHSALQLRRPGSDRGSAAGAVGVTAPALPTQAQHAIVLAEAIDAELNGQVSFAMSLFERAIQLLLMEVREVCVCVCVNSIIVTLCDIVMP